MHRVQVSGPVLLGAMMYMLADTCHIMGLFPVINIHVIQPAGYVTTISSTTLTETASKSIYSAMSVDGQQVQEPCTVTNPYVTTYMYCSYGLWGVSCTHNGATFYRFSITIVV